VQALPAMCRGYGTDCAVAICSEQMYMQNAHASYNVTIPKHTPLTAKMGGETRTPPVSLAHVQVPMMRAIEIVIQYFRPACNPRVHVNVACRSIASRSTHIQWPSMTRPAHDQHGGKLWDWLTVALLGKHNNLAKHFRI
jgi:hypothetical protein